MTWLSHCDTRDLLPHLLLCTTTPLLLDLLLHPQAPHLPHTSQLQPLSVNWPTCLQALQVPAVGVEVVVEEVELEEWLQLPQMEACIPPAIFDGTHTMADEFWAQFRHYKLVNHTHDSMTKPFDYILTMLTYIWGPMINDWVNAQEQHLSDQMDTTKLNAVHEDDEVLWMEFKTTFADAWMDTSMRQNTYNQLMKLTMAGWDINTYIATFEWLALAAGWALNTEGVIVQFWEGLSKGIHSKALDRDKIPHMMDKWKVVAHTEVTRAK